MKIFLVGFGIICGILISVAWIGIIYGILAGDNYSVENELNISSSSGENYQTTDITPSREPISSSAAMSDEDFIELCATGTVQNIEVAIRNGANVNAKNDDGVTALMYAAANNSNPEVVSVLVKNRADVNAKFNNNGKTVLMVAAHYSSNPEVVSALVKGGADISAKDNGGNGAIVYLSENENLKDNTSAQQLLTAANTSNSAPARSTSKPQNRTEARSSQSAGSTYQAIFDEYSQKIRAATPRLINEYKAEAARNRRGIEGLAEISGAKVEKLAEISGEGTSKMAEIALFNGMGSYMEWAMKLNSVYMEEAGKITSAYMSSAMDTIFQ